MESGYIDNIQRMSVQDGPGLRTTVFLKGCPLKCLWCSNPESQSFHPQLMFFKNLCQGCGSCLRACPYDSIVQDGNKFITDLSLCQNCGACVAVCPSKARVMSGKIMTVKEVMYVVQKDELFYRNSGGGVTFGGGEPTNGGEFLIAMLKACKNVGYHICLDTCGHCPTERFKEIIGLVDLVLFDCKHTDAAQHKLLTNQDNKLILANLKEAIISGVETRFRFPLISNLNDSEENIKTLASILREFNRSDVDVLPYHLFGSNKYLALQRQPPSIIQYTPEEFQAVLKRFTYNGLKVTIV